jgi:GTP-binding protein YchF
MGVACGIVGLPNVGKSTLFNAMTRAGVPAENYPFCTIDPHTGIAVVPDPRLTTLAGIVGVPESIPAVVEFVDIAGLVEGASRGEGLGNRFLSHIRETDAVAHVVRCFDDPDVAHIGGAIDPVADIETVEVELALADLETTERAIDRHGRRARAGDKQERPVLEVLERARAHLAAGSPIRTLPLGGGEGAHLAELQLLTAKPVVYVANVDDTGTAGNPYLGAVEAYAASRDATVVALAARLEAEIAELDEADRREFLAEVGEQEPGLDRMVHAAYDLLGLGTFFTYNEKEARAWTFVRGSRAPQAAGRIHTDFERGFIKAEVVSFDDFVACGGEHAAREAGKWRVEGKDYVVQEGDVIYFRFQV